MFIRRVRIVAKSAYYVMTVHPHEYVQMSMKLHTGDFPEYVEKIQIWLKSDKNIGHFTSVLRMFSYCRWHPVDTKMLSLSDTVQGC